MDKITVCVCTYKRPSLLPPLLSALTNQITQNMFTYDIVIVDNDEFQTGRQPIEQFLAENRKIPISYYVEKNQNIALARNKAIEKASGNFIAFMDDDELPSDKWLHNLFKSIKKFDADGVLGPVIPLFVGHPPNWVIRGRIFNRPRFRTGQYLDWRDTRTGNVLLKREIFEKSPVWFRKEFGSGGEDRDFFKRKIEEGCRFVWCDEAKIFEFVPEIRWNLIYQMRRSLLRGKIAYISNPNSIKSLIFTVLAIAIYSLSLPLLFILSPMIGYEFFIKKFISFFDHLGKLLELLRLNPIKEKYITA